MDHQLPNEDALLYSYSDFILTSSLARRAALFDGFPIFQLFIRDIIESIFRLQQNCHMPEFTEHGLRHICSLVDRISLWTCEENDQYPSIQLTKRLSPEEATILLLATIIHDMGMLSQNPEDIPPDNPIRFQIGAMSLSEWVRKTHVSRLNNLFRRTCNEQCVYWDKIKDNDIINISIKIAEAHQLWPWENDYCRDLTIFAGKDIRIKGLAAIIAVSDLLDEDSTRCSTMTLLQHKAAPVKSKAHWIRHALTDGRVLVENGAVFVEMLAVPMMDKSFIPLYILLRNHYKLVKLYNECLKDFGAQIINIIASPKKDIPQRYVSSTSDIEKIIELSTPLSLLFYLVDTFFPESRFREDEIKDRVAYQYLSDIGLETCELDWYYDIKGKQEPLTEYEITFRALKNGADQSNDAFVIALDYLREKAREAHATGQGYLANHFSAIALDAIIKKNRTLSEETPEDISSFLPLEDISWCVVFALYWQDSGLPYQYCEEILKYYSSKCESAQNSQGKDCELLSFLNKLLALYKNINIDKKDLIKAIISSDLMFYNDDRLEDEALLIMYVELLFVIDSESDIWLKVAEHFKSKCRAMGDIRSRLTHQANILYPWINFEEEEYLSKSERLNFDKWDSLLQYDLEKYRDASTQAQQIESLNWETLYGEKLIAPPTFDPQQPSQYLRATKVDLDSGFFNNKNVIASFYQNLIQIQHASGNIQSEFTSCIRSTRISEMRALRYWNLFYLFHSWYQQALAMLILIENSRHYEYVNLVPNTILFLVMSRQFKKKDERHQRLVYLMDLLRPEEINSLIDKLLKLKPMMHYYVIEVLSILSDAIPNRKYYAVADWCSNYEEAQRPRGAGYDLSWPTFLGPMMEMGNPPERFYRKIYPIVTRFAQNSKLWQLDRPRLLSLFMVHAPLEIAKNIIDYMLKVDCMNDIPANGIRWEIIANAVLCRKELSYIHKKLSSTTLGADLKLLNTSFMENNGTPVDDEAGREHIRSTIHSLLNSIQTRKERNYSMGGYLSPQFIRRATWPDEEKALIKEIVDTLNSGKCLHNEAYYFFLYLAIFCEIKDDVFESLIVPVKNWMRTRPITHDLFEGFPGVVSYGKEVDLPYSGLCQLLYEIVKRSDRTFNEFVARWLVLETMDIQSSLAPYIYTLSYQLGVVSNELSVVDMVSIVRGLIGHALIEMEHSSEVAIKLLDRMASVMASVKKEDLLSVKIEKVNKHLNLIQILVRKTANHEDPDLRAASARVLLSLKRHMEDSFPNDLNDLVEYLRKDNRKRVINAIEKYSAQ